MFPTVHTFPEPPRRLARPGGRAGSFARPTAHDACARPSGARAGANFRLPPHRLAGWRGQFAVTAPLPYLSRLLAEDHQHALDRVAEGQFQAALHQLAEHAKNSDLSQRQLARQLGLPESTLRKIMSGRADAHKWLPKLQPVLRRLTSN